MKGRPRKYNDQAAEVIRLHSVGHTVREIEAATGISRATVARMIRRYMDAHNPLLTP